jgi:inhibitor of KinA sporulation pathway (predicted exonuclease)
MSLDLELNQPSGNIIQVGAIVGNTDTQKILAELNIYVQLPTKYEKVTEYITNLTGITQDQVDKGISPKETYFKLKEFSKKWECFRNPVVWGGGDSNALYKQANPGESNFMGFRWIDVKTIYQSIRIANSMPRQGGLAKSMIKMGLKFDGKKHNAVDDAKNTLLFYFHMLNLLKEVTKNEPRR